MKKTMMMGIMLLAMASGNVMAQKNVYVNDNMRTRIINNVDNITFDDGAAKLWSAGKCTAFPVSSTMTMSVMEKDEWKSKVMPADYLSDFNYDIAFLDSDKSLVKAEKEVTDEKHALYDDFLAHSTWDKTVNISYSANDAVVTGNTSAVTVEKKGAHVVVKSSSSGVRYVLTGESSNGSFKLYSEKKACVTLNGVTLTNPNGPALNSQSKKRLYIDLAQQTKNTLTDGATYTKVTGEDQRGCIFAEGKLCIGGTGELYVVGNKKSAIASDTYVHLLNGFVHATANVAKAKAVYAKENIIVGGGVLRAYTDGTIGKAITSDSLITITGGVVKAITAGDCQWDDDKQDYSSGCALKCDYDMSITGGDIYCLATGSGGKGISAGNSVTTEVNGKVTEKHLGTLTISDANVYVRTSGIRIPEVKTEDDHGQKTEASASPKGMKSADKMIINSGNIFVRCSGGAAAEGIESKRAITINGGKVRTYCVDDGMNAEGCYINGGDVLICSTENDGFDVSYLFLNGGKLYCIGAGADQMGIDTDGKTFKVMGGELVSIGGRNCLPYSSGSQASVLCYLKKNVSYVALADAEGNIIKAVPTPDTYNPLSVLLSVAQLKQGSTYKILSYKTALSDTPEVEYTFTPASNAVQLGNFK